MPDGPATDAALMEKLAGFDTLLAEYNTHMSKMELRKATAALRALWALGNEWLQEAAPWTLFKTDPERAATIINVALNLIRAYAVLSEPFIPDACETMMNALNSDDNQWPENLSSALGALPTGHSFSVPETLFTKITDEARVEMETRFAGQT